MREKTAPTAVATSAAARPAADGLSAGALAAMKVVDLDAANVLRAVAILTGRDRETGSPAGGGRIPATVRARPAAGVMVRLATASALPATALAPAHETVSVHQVVTEPLVLPVMVRVRLVMGSGLAVTEAPVLLGMGRVRLVTGSGLVATAVRVLPVTVRVRLVRVSVPGATGAARVIAAVTVRLGMSRSVAGSTATRGVVGSAEIATGSSGRAADAVDATRSCGRGKAAPREVIGMRATESVNSPKRSGWRGSCGPFGLGTTILTSPTTSNRATSTRVRGSS